MKMKITWKNIQNESSEILASGLYRLTKAEKCKLDEHCHDSYGNYLISGSQLNYIGEGKNLQKRLLQQSKERTSTFYKNYLKLKANNLAIPQNLTVNDFTVRTIKTQIGRKEIEEFGIVNLPANLNRFQKGKRQKYQGEVIKELWFQVNDQVEKLLSQGEKDLMDLKRTNWIDCFAPTCAGLYWIENKKGELIYVGESSNIFDRWSVHSDKTYFSALRRNIGRTFFGFELQTINGKKRYFTEKEDKEISKFLTNAKILTYPVEFGRFELEEFLIRKYRPTLNRKENCKNTGANN